ncbi:MAG: ABC transporter ATP-binding protein [Candidatus Methanoplasma sp.]|jgi:ABC-2 type transport system ATP-binding protein|nr:ABC transporter ATP-binding protein [Candidatus Methanoplasma sp.]
MGIIIKAEGLKKSFDGFEAVRCIDIEVEEGEVFGFLGPNGAGKTTSIRMLTTMVRPTSGNITINGFSLDKDMTEAKASIGVCQQHISLDKDITVRQNIKHHAILHKMPSKEIAARMDELSEFMCLGPHMDKKITELSGGWKRKTSIVCSIMHKPKILFLDEPTAGLDTKSRHMLWDLIRQLNRSGTTIFLTTHYIEEAEDLCDRVAILNQGTVVALGSPKELRDSIGGMTVEYSDDAGRKVMRQFPDRQSGKEFMATLGENTTMSLRRTTLEDVFLIVTGEEYSKGGA